MIRAAARWLRSVHFPSYVIFFVTGICNARCRMCFYMENMEKSDRAKELTVEEYDRITRPIPFINILGISGGEPFLRDDLAELVGVIYRNTKPLVVDLPTNAYLAERIVPQVERICRECPEMVVDLQFSVDGPPDVHDAIRGLPEGFARLRETYARVAALKARNPNLRLKACVVYSAFNKDRVAELFPILDRDFPALDRVVFSVVHGTASEDASYDFDWDHYFRLCEDLRRRSRVASLLDLHSLFTIALRQAKNEVLKEVLAKKDMYRRCGAGVREIVVSESGQVFPCEPLWESVGDLRKQDYDLLRILRSPEMTAFQRRIRDGRCNCHWGLPLSNTLLYSPRYYGFIAAEMVRILGRSLVSPRS